MTPEQVQAWRKAAVADGWTLTPTYDREPVERAGTLRCDGWMATYLDRPGCASLTAWGPDGLTIAPPECYGMAALVAGLRTCNNCGAANVETQRYSFAGRCCAECRPEMTRRFESPGWTR